MPIEKKDLTISKIYQYLADLLDYSTVDVDKEWEIFKSQLDN
jgi:hypothetical protein